MDTERQLESTRIKTPAGGSILCTVHLKYTSSWFFAKKSQLSNPVRGQAV
jgi:hypothetical protein